ncbi:3-hydroxyacyl-CoA dehydrogenase family protein [Cupriavidus pauculus]|uniref:3-hydroxyacyl-CoA dehydrogenase family protein n=1 Tax=Cupriavidus pauculus TaxID=82633 RepID=UPI001FD3BAED|nr:3-hydroxyacyl-CoA dehydrogenase family protein [Cupriavidus pauculus]
MGLILESVLVVGAGIDAAGKVGLVIEAIAENAEAKRQLFVDLENVVSSDCILATNTSSLSITAMANGMKHPGRLVEVVSGVHTTPQVAKAVSGLSSAWRKVPVQAASTPGFIVNRLARPFYAEALALLSEQASTPQVVDACLRGAGFRMGPCELMDLIGHDTNFAVTMSVYEANFFDKRFVPSRVQRDLVDGGLLGRKSGRGFYRYPAGAPALASEPCREPERPRSITVYGDTIMADRLESLLTVSGARCGARLVRKRATDWTGFSIGDGYVVLSDGRTAAEMAAVTGSRNTAVMDRPMRFPVEASTPLAYAVHPLATDGWGEGAAAWLTSLGFAPQRLTDCPGLVVTRTIAMLINEAADAVLQGVCTAEGADVAMKLGVNYPAGLFEWLDDWSVAGVCSVLAALDDHYRGERYRISAWLRRRVMQ